MDTVTLNYILLALASTAVGYGLFWAAYKILPKRLDSDHKKQHAEILNDARTIAEERTSTEKAHTLARLQVLSEELDAEIEEKKTDLDAVREELDSLQHSLDIEQGRLLKSESSLEQKNQKTSAKQQKLAEKQQEIESVRQQLITTLSQKSEAQREESLSMLTNKIIHERQINTQKYMKFLEDDLNVNAKRLSDRLMTRSLSRYSPNFYWPKSQNSIEVPDQKTAEALASNEQFFKDIIEVAEINAELITEKVSPEGIIKLSGGAGIDREAARLTFAELISKHPNTWGKAKATYDEHRAKLELEAERLGLRAIQEVNLLNIHPEIQKLIGYLNWRTSYRQNQWHHTLEVAQLAGIIADEIGVDSDEAKRCGLLHDIGKAIDYRIEGSHAVISGDYADRYGEKKVICDTVMSHHNDLIVETPLSFILKTADTLSGARPGARVNLEEGYQMRLSGINDSVRSFKGVIDVAIMNGAREVHVEVNPNVIGESQLSELSQEMAKKISDDVAFPGEIKILISRTQEATSVA